MFGSSCLTAKRMLLCPSLITAFILMFRVFTSFSRVARLFLSADARFLAKSVVFVVLSFSIQRVSFPFSGCTPSNSRIMPSGLILFRYWWFCSWSALFSARYAWQRRLISDLLMSSFFRCCLIWFRVWCLL